jgi:hypothetical protein
MNKDTQMLFEAYGTIYRGPKTEQDSKDYGMNLAPFMGIIHKLAKGTFDTDSDQDHVAKGELQGVFEVDVVDGHRQVVLTNDAIEAAGNMHPELKDKFWECGKCKADYAGCSAAKQHDADDFRDQMPDSKEEYSAHDYAKEMEMSGEDEESKHPLGDVRDVQARDLKPGDVLSLFKNTVIKIDDMAPRLIKGKVRVTYKDIRGVVHNVDWNKGTKISVDNAPHEDEQRRLDPKCWSGYHKDGTKMKGGTRVNNCVKNEQEEGADEEGDLMMHMKQKGMINKKADASTGEYGHRKEEEESDQHALRDVVADLLNISHKMWKEMNMDSFYSARDLEVVKSHAESILRRVKDVAEEKSKVTSVSHNGYRRILKTFK